MKHPFAFCCLALLSVSPLMAEHVKPSDIRPDRELLITHPAVVDSEFAQYPGPWSFGALIEELVGKEQAPEAVYQWLECFYWNSSVGQRPREDLPRGIIPGPPSSTMKCFSTTSAASKAESIPGRPDIAAKLIRPWQQRDGYDPASGRRWKPNLANAPFRLLAIVNRMDLAATATLDVRNKVQERWKQLGKEDEFNRLVSLATDGTTFQGLSFPRGSLGYGGSGSFSGGKTEPENSGEGRLVFGAVGPDGRVLEGGWTLIFEYHLFNGGLPIVPGASVAAASARRWAESWHALGTLELEDHRYREELAKITRRFTHRQVDEKGGIAPGAKTSFAQLRSNEGAFGPGREFRQFELVEGALVPAALPLTPAGQFTENTREGGRLLAGFLHEIEPLILSGLHSLPPRLSDRGKDFPLLAGRATIPEGEPDFHWETQPRIAREARRLFSMGTCNGCHAGETGCPDGLHVHPRDSGLAAKLSSFLRTDGQANRFQDPGLKTSYVRQREMEDRAAILAALLEPKESKRLDALEDILRERLRRAH
jgi:hypothetical protein